MINRPFTLEWTCLPIFGCSDVGLFHCEDSCFVSFIHIYPFHHLWWPTKRLLVLKCFDTCWPSSSACHSIGDIWIRWQSTVICSFFASKCFGMIYMRFCISLVTSWIVWHLILWTGPLICMIFHPICLWMGSSNVQCLYYMSFHFWTWNITLLLFPLQMQVLTCHSYLEQFCLVLNRTWYMCTVM